MDNGRAARNVGSMALLSGVSCDDAPSAGSGVVLLAAMDREPAAAVLVVGVSILDGTLDDTPWGDGVAIVAVALEWG